MNGTRFWVLLLLLLLGASVAPGSSRAGSFNRLPNPPPAREAAASEPAKAQAAPPAALAEDADARGEAETSSKDSTEASSDAPRTEAAEVATEDEEVAEEVVPEGEPTYGGACIYGPRGVVHAPVGRDCEAEQAFRAGEAKAANVERVRDAPLGSGRCIFGQHGEVVYAPPGVQCDGKVRDQEPDKAGRTPRIIRYRPGR